MLKLLTFIIWATTDNTMIILGAPYGGQILYMTSIWRGRIPYSTSKKIKGWRPSIWRSNPLFDLKKIPYGGWMVSIDTIQPPIWPLFGGRIWPFDRLTSIWHQRCQFRVARFKHQYCGILNATFWHFKCHFVVFYMPKVFLFYAK